MLAFSAKKTASPSTAALEALEAARQHLADCRREAAAHTGAVARANSALDAATAARDAARKAAEGAKEAVVAHALAIARGDDVAPPMSPARARAALAEAEEAAATAAHVLEAIKTSAPYSGDVSFAEDRLAHAAAAVARELPEYAALVDETEQLAIRLSENLSALAFLGKAGVVGHDREAWPTRPYKISNLAHQAPGMWSELLNQITHTQTKKWQARIESLKTDATAPLPAAK